LQIDLSKIGYDDKLNIKNEIVLHSELNHPNIVKFYDWFKEGEKIMMILEHCEGGTMFRYLDNNHKLPTDVIRKFIYESCLALLYLHERGIVHRDIKPENLLLDEKLNVKLCDFGWCSHISKIKQT
jgi:serine/threonine protein kinase